jgi:hypothetical protein
VFAVEAAGGRVTGFFLARALEVELRRVRRRVAMQVFPHGCPVCGSRGRFWVEQGSLGRRRHVCTVSPQFEWVGLRAFLGS